MCLQRSSPFLFFARFRGRDIHTFLRMYRQVQSNTENMSPQLAKLPPMRGDSRRIVCGGDAAVERTHGGAAQHRYRHTGGRAQDRQHNTAYPPHAGRSTTKAHKTHIERANNLVALGRVLQPSVCVPQPTTERAHAKSATDVIQNAVRARFATVLDRLLRRLLLHLWVVVQTRCGLTGPYVCEPEAAALRRCRCTALLWHWRWLLACTRDVPAPNAAITCNSPASCWCTRRCLGRRTALAAAVLASHGGPPCPGCTTHEAPKADS